MHKAIAALLLLASFLLPAHTAYADPGINDLRSFDTCANYGATGSGKTDTLFQALFPGRFAVVAGGALNGRAGPNNEPVWLVLNNTTNEPIPLGYEVSSGFFCEAGSYDAVINHANKTGSYVGYLDLSPTEDEPAQAIVVQSAASSEPASASQFVAVGGIMLNRDLNECYTEPTGVGATVTKTWNVQPGRTLYAFAWSINGSTRPAWVSVPGTTNGMVSLTVTDGIVVVCSSPLAFTPEVFDGFTELSINGVSQLDGQHLLTQSQEVVDAETATAQGDSIAAQINWVKKHNQVLLDAQKATTVATVQKAPAPVATPLAPQTVASTFFPERKTTGAGARLDFTKGMPVLGAFIQFKSGGTRELCRYDAAPEDGFVISGVIGTPFEGEKLKPCGG